MSISYTLSEIAADFGSGAKHIANNASPFLTFEFGTPPKIFKSTMVKHGGMRVQWQQPVLLTGATTSRLMITAMSHKSLLKDSTIGTGVVDLAQAAAQTGPVVVQLSGKTGVSAGTVQFVVTRGQGAGVGNVNQPTPDSSGVVEGVGGPGRNIEGGSLPAGGMGTGQHQGAGMGAGAALGAAAGGMAARHEQKRAMENDGMQNNGMGNNGMGGGMVGGSSGYDNGQSGVMQQQQQQPGGMGMGGGMMPQGGQQGGMMPQGGQQGVMSGGEYGNNQMVPGQQQGMMPQEQGMMQQQQGGLGGGMGPQESYEKHAHNVHDHDENETYERRNIG
jgi:hypothetical protein